MMNIFLLGKEMKKKKCDHYEVAKALNMTVYQFENKILTNGFGSLDIERMVAFLEIQEPQKIFFVK